MWMNFIVWFRIFKEMTFYFDLIKKTITEMIWFLIIYVLIILACGNALYILNVNRIQGEGDVLYEESFSSGLGGFINAFLN